MEASDKGEWGHHLKAKWKAITQGEKSMLRRDTDAPDNKTSEFLGLIYQPCIFIFAFLISLHRM